MYLPIGRLCCVMVNVLAIGPNVRGFIHCRGDGLLGAIEIRSTPSFGREVKPEAPHCNILYHVKITSMYEQRYFEGQIHHFLPQVSLDFLLDGSAGRITREL
jgi:hypothetical protein